MEGKTYVGWSPKDWGLFYAIENNWGTCYLCHLKENFCPSDSQVTQGQLIGKTDNTGNSTGPHLHIGLRVKGIKDPEMKDFVDPLPYFEEEKEEKSEYVKQLEEDRKKFWEERDKLQKENEELKKQILNLNDQLSTMAKTIEQIKSEDLSAGLKELEAEKKLADALKDLQASEKRISELEEGIKVAKESETELLGRLLEQERLERELEKLKKEKGGEEMAKEYSSIKKCVWRFVRVAVAGGLASASALKFDLSDPKNVIIVLLTAFISGALEAVTKYLREGADSYDSLVHKLPV